MLKKNDYMAEMLKELDIQDLSELEGMDVAEFRKQFKQSKYRLRDVYLDFLISAGYIKTPAGEKHVRDLPISVRLRNILLRNNIYFLSDIKAYSREDVMKFRNMGVGTMKEFDDLMQRENIELQSLSKIESRMLGVHFSNRQLSKFFYLHIYGPEDLFELSEEDVAILTTADKGIMKKIKQVRSLAEKGQKIE